MEVWVTKQANEYVDHLNFRDLVVLGYQVILKVKFCGYQVILKVKFVIVASLPVVETANHCGSEMGSEKPLFLSLLYLSLPIILPCLSCCPSHWTVGYTSRYHDQSPLDSTLTHPLWLQDILSSRG